MYISKLAMSLRDIYRTVTTLCSIANLVFTRCQSWVIVSRYCPTVLFEWICPSLLLTMLTLTAMKWTCTFLRVLRRWLRLKSSCAFKSKYLLLKPTNHVWALFKTVYLARWRWLKETPLLTKSWLCNSWCGYQKNSFKMLLSVFRLPPFWSQNLCGQANRSSVWSFRK